MLTSAEEDDEDELELEPVDEPAPELPDEPAVPDDPDPALDVPVEPEPVLVAPEPVPGELPPVDPRTR